MRKNTVLLKILYFTEDNDLVLHCPQLAMYGVCEEVLKDKSLKDELILDYFEEKLQARTARFESRAAFLEKLVFDSHWNFNATSISPKTLDYFIGSQSIIKELVNLPDIKKLDYKFKYPLEALKRIIKHSNSSTS